ncbi:MAG: molybdate ABC transporter substrate-binding protein [Parvibaculaceae bacterium]
MRPFRNFAGAFFALLAMGFAALPAQADDAPLVFAASSLTDVLGTIAKDYEADTGKRVTFSFAASSVLARQIEAGSPAAMFISADKDWMDYVSDKGLMKADTRKNLVGNELVLIAPAATTTTVAIAPDFALLDALGGGRLAIGDPDSVPAGKYARAALTSLHVWGVVVDHLALAENVRVALAYVARGEAPYGIVYTTDALSQPKVRIVGTFPSDTHLPIVYPVALTKSASAGAAAFEVYLSGTKAKARFAAAGFTSLNEGSAQ